MKKLNKKWVTSVALILCTLFSPLAVFCSSWNGEGTGGEMGAATTNTYIANTRECSGIRATIVDDTGARVNGTKSVDYMWRVTGGKNAFHFSGKKSKIEYRAVSNTNDLNLISGDYSYINANEFIYECGLYMPSIVITSGSNITKIKNWLTSKETKLVPNKIAKDCGLTPTAPYEGNTDSVNLYRNTMCRYNYHILIEPVGSVVVQGVPYVGTATELAFLAQRSGCAWNYLGTYIDMQLPLSMYLSYTQLGIPAAKFSATRQSREDIITYLGCAITSYQRDGTDITDDPYRPDDDPQPEIAIPATNYAYHIDTDVYTSVKIQNTSGKDILDTAWVEFSIPDLGLTMRMDKIALPEGGSQLAYCDWHTPNKAVASMTIKVKCSNGIKIVTASGLVSETEIHCSISNYSNQEPPDTRYEDKRGSWTYPSVRMAESSSLGATWGHWEYTNSDGGDKEIDIWYYHEDGYYSYHPTGNQMNSATQISNSMFYRLVDLQECPEVYEYGQWETHTDELWVEPDAGGYELRESPTPTKTVVTYLGDTPYQTSVIVSTRDDIAWRNEQSLSNELLSEYHGTTFYVLNNGPPTTTKPTASDLSQTLKQYSYAKAVSDDNHTFYMYKVTAFKADYGPWVSQSPTVKALSRDYGTSGTYAYPSNTSRVYYRRISVVYSEKTYYGSDAFLSARSDTSTWNRRVTVDDYYTWTERTKRLVSEAYVEYVYEMYDTTWNDSGSHWTTEKLDLSTQQQSWKWIEESVSVVSSAVLIPDDRCPTDYELNGVTYMKSGYGVRLAYTPVITALGRSKSGNKEHTNIQRVEAWFPEFGFNSNHAKAYSRVLERVEKNASGDIVYSFPSNRYSRFCSRLHFTPLWYPDNTAYVVRVNAYELWTPAGQLSMWTESDPIIISGGSFYDDWAIGLYKP